MKQFLFFIGICFSLSSFAQPNIKSGEFFWGTTDPGQGLATAFTASDGAWNEAVEEMIAAAQAMPNLASPNVLNIRLKDVNNHWGPLYKQVAFFSPGVAQTRTLSITTAEYFWGIRILEPDKAPHFWYLIAHGMRPWKRLIKME
jgi:hypothetical protein